MSGWQPVTRSWTRGSIFCCDAPSSGRSTASLEGRPVSREASSFPSAGMSAPFRTQRRAVLIRFKGLIEEDRKTGIYQSSRDSLSLDSGISTEPRSQTSGSDFSVKRSQMKIDYSLGWWERESPWFVCMNYYVMGSQVVKNCLKYN